MEREVREVLEAAWNELHDHQKAPWQKLAVGDGMERFRRFLDAEAYTDAALMLVPEGGWWVQHIGHCLRGWRCRIETNGPPSVSIGAGFLPDEPLPHPALAIAQASIKTKEAEHAPE